MGKFISKHRVWLKTQNAAHSPHCAYVTSGLCMHAVMIPGFLLVREGEEDLEMARHH